MQNKDYVDEQIYRTLKVAEKPSQELNRTIIEQMNKSNSQVNSKKYYKPFSKLALVVTIILVGSISVYATLKLLSPVEVVTATDNKKLALAFGGTDSEIINKSKVCGPFMVTLQGIVSGESISDFANSSPGEYPCKTYTVISISRTDGNEMRADYEDSSKIFVSPYIKGIKPWQCNLAIMNGSSTQFIQDGILYRVIECDNIEMFADRGLYIGVSLNGIVDNKDFDYNESTGELKGKNTSGLESVVFDLPIEPSKADPKEADAYLATLGTIEVNSEVNHSPQETLAQDQQSTETASLLTESSVIEGSIQVVQPDENGMVHYNYSPVTNEEHSSEYLAEAYFQQGEVKDDVLVSTSRPLSEKNIDEPFYFTTMSQNERGDIIIKTYMINK